MRGHVVILVLCVATAVQAFSNLRSSIPNGNNVQVNGVSVGGVGHTSTAGGGALNTFGTAFKAAGTTWTASLCAADSDGDGQTNGYELGDPDCTWTSGGTPTRTTDISHPGDATSTTSATPAPTTAVPPTPAPTPLPPGATPTPTTAAPTTTVAATTTVAETPQPATKFAQATSINVFSEFLDVSWSIFSNSSTARRSGTSGDIMDLEMVFSNTSSEQWGGIGFASTGMQGPLVIAYVDADGNAQVSEYTGTSTSVNVRTGSSSVVSASVTATTRTVTIRIPLDEVGVSSTQLRTIFAKGSWSGGPSKHDATAKKQVNFYTGDTTELANTKANTFFGFIIAIVVVLLVTLIGGIMNCAGFVPSPLASKLLWVLCFFIFFCLLVFVMLMSWSDYSMAGQSAAIGRSLGDGATFCFFMLLWPTTKHIGPAKVFGISYERFLLPHLVCGCLILILMTAHFGIMYDSVAKSDGADGARTYIFSWKPDSPPGGTSHGPRLAGFLSWVFLVIIAIPAIFLRRIAFSFFRAMHFLFIFVIVFGAIHHWPLWIFIAPGFIVWIIDLVLRAVGAAALGATAQSATYHEAAGCTELTMGVKDFTLGPGQYCFLSVDPVGGFMHPFSVVSYDKGAQTVKFMIKNMGKGTFTEAVALAAKEGKVGPGAVMMGPYGMLQVPLTKPNHIVLCSGGIGVTPMMSTLQYLGQQFALGELKQVQSIKFVWSIPTEELLQVMMVHLNVAVQTILDTGRSIEVFVHITRTNFTATAPWFTVVNKRPTWKDYIVKTSDSELLAAYACGPEKMMDDVSSAASHNGAYLHTETFAF